MRSPIRPTPCLGFRSPHCSPATVASPSCSSRRTAGVAAFLLERRPARAVDPRRAAAGVRGCDAVGCRLGTVHARRIARDRRRRRLAPRHRGGRGRRRSPRRHRGSGHAVLASCSSRTASPRRCSSRRREPFRPTASSSPATRRCRSTASAFLMCRSGRRSETGDAPVHLTGYGGFGVPDPAPLQLGDRQTLAGARRHQRHRQYPRRRRVRQPLARGRPPRREATLARRFRRRRRRSRAARRDSAGAHRGRGRLEWRDSHHQHAGALSGAFRRLVLHHSADRHAPLQQAARRRELDRRIRRSRQARGLGLPPDLFRLSPRRARAVPIRRS